jgi:DNA-directed RNA polymerase specialized sigma24 family protein
MKRDAADLHWLAYLLTGRRDLSIEIAVDTVASPPNRKQFFSDWMGAWARRIVIARALAAVRDELAESARRTRLARNIRSARVPRGWSLNPQTNKAQIERALLAMDIFPRAVVVLSILEGVRISDAAVILDADATLVRKAQALGAYQLVRKLARKPDDAVPEYAPPLRLALATR